MDSSLNAMHISMIYGAITSLESGIVRLSEVAKDEKEIGQDFHGLYHFCRLAKNKLGLKLRSYFNWYKNSKMEKFKFLFVPYNVWLYGDAGSSHLRELLGWGTVADLERFMLETLNDRAGQPHSTSLFSLRLAWLNSQTTGTSLRVSNAVRTPNRRARCDLPSSPLTSLSETPETPDTPEAPKSSKRRYRDNLDSSHLRAGDDSAIFKRARESENQSATMLRGPLETQVSVYFKLCLQADEIDPYDDPRRSEGENIEKYFERMARATMNFWRRYDLDMLRAVAKCVLSIPGSNAFVERVFSCIKDVATDRRYKMSETTLQRIALSKFALKYTHIPLADINNQFLSDYVKESEAKMDQIESAGSGLDLDPEHMFPWSDITADGVKLLKQVGRSEYFFPENYDELERNLNEIGDL
jgi:hypothetical protein